MLKEIGSIMKYVIIAVVYIVLFRIVRTMYVDVKRVKTDNSPLSFALEVEDTPDSINIHKGSVFPVHSVTDIGRKDDNTIMIKDGFVSSYHARIIVKNNRIFIEDLKSTNGTFKNGTKIDGIEELLNGDTLEIGRTMFKVIG
jgi:hypothetical protein